MLELAPAEGGNGFDRMSGRKCGVGTGTSTVHMQCSPTYAYSSTCTKPVRRQRCAGEFRPNCRSEDDLSIGYLADVGIRIYRSSTEICSQSIDETGSRC